ncbi:uncharacterized protein LOC142355219 [Convolutriloba macropyga]|uniref:uncharacterized protein LOC142355219 n=1 Tax=Convolutriloba macropyga TaxID=536237 RepID=UPI003F520E2D
MSGQGIPFGTENGDTKIALDAAEFSAQLNLTKSFQVSTQSVNTLWVSINGFVMIPCNPGGTDSPAKPPDFYNLNESVVIAPAIINNQAVNIISNDSNAYNLFYRELNSTDYSEVDSVINDTRFETSWGFVSTWYKVGDLVNNYTLTNSFQLILACDDTYWGTNQERCVSIFVYGELNYAQNSDGDAFIAGINAANNAVNFTIHSPSTAVVYVIELKQYSNDAFAIVTYDPDNWTNFTSTTAAPSTTLGPGPVTNPAPGPVTTPASGRATNPATGPATNPAPGPATTPASEPATNPAPGPVTTPASRRATNPAPGPVTTPDPGPATTPASEPATNPAPGPVTTPASRRATNPAPGPVTTPDPGPAATPASEPATNPAPGPVTTSDPGPATTPASEPATNPAPGPVATAASGPETNPSPGPAITPASGPETNPAPGLATTPASGPETNPAPGPATTPGSVPGASVTVTNVASAGSGITDILGSGSSSSTGSVTTPAPGPFTTDFPVPCTTAVLGLSSTTSDGSATTNSGSDSTVSTGCIIASAPDGLKSFTENLTPTQTLTFCFVLTFVIAGRKLSETL